MLKRRIITLFTSLAMGLTSLSCAPVYVNAEGISSPAAMTDEERITDIAVVREMFDQFIAEKGLNITCAEPGKYPQYTDQIVIEFDLNEEDYIELLNYAADNNIDRNSFTYMAYSDGVLMTTTSADPNRTTTTTTTAVNTPPVTAQPLMTDTSGRIIDADGNVIIVNGTSAVMSGTPKGTTTTIAGSGSFALLSSSYTVNVGETGSIARCGAALPDSWTVDNDDVISLDETGLRFTGLRAGTATITYNSKGAKQTATVTVTNVTTTTTTTTTISYPTTTAMIDYMTQVDYDKSPMKVGEVRRINFSHPTGETTGGSVYSSSDLIEIIYENGNNYFDVKALKEGEASISVHARGCAFDPTVTIKVIASEPEITTQEEPEVWMYGTGVDHFDSVNTLPTKTIYDEGEELDLSGLVINAYHSVMRHSNKGNAEYLKTDYVWEVEDIAPEYITISSLTGKKYTADQFPTLIGGNAYTVKIGKRGSTMITLKVKGEQSEKELYDFESFTFRIYINPADKHSEFIHIDNAEVETFGYGTTSHGFKLKGMEAFSIDMDAYMHAGYEIEGGIQEGDSVSGVLCINPKNYYIYFGDLDIVKYGGVNGDANADGSVDMADAVLIMQALANPNKYGIGGMDERCMTKRGFALADQNGDGITVLDAQLIQNKLLGLS
jgi:hypothetical protein